jgi:hypothetical protein
VPQFHLLTKVIECLGLGRRKQPFRDFDSLRECCHDKNRAAGVTATAAGDLVITTGVYEFNDPFGYLINKTVDHRGILAQ